MSDSPSIVFLCRDSAAACYLAQEMARHFKLAAIVLESGSSAGLAKLRRLTRKKRWWQWPVVVFDLSILAGYSFLMNRYISRYFFGKSRHYLYPSVPIIQVKDANDQRAFDRINAIKPDVVVVWGTSILKKNMLSLPFKILNIHGGIVPEYRNVHSEFWALYRNDYGKIGTTVMHLNKGVDTGDIATQATIEFRNGDSVFKARRKNIELAASLIIWSIKNYYEKKLPSIKQDDSRSGYYPTPSGLEIISLLLRLGL